jgi:hypothetical protein
VIVAQQGGSCKLFIIQSTGEVKKKRGEQVKGNRNMGTRVEIPKLGECIVSIFLEARMFELSRVARQTPQ